MTGRGYQPTSRRMTWKERLSHKTGYQNQHVCFSENCGCFNPDSRRLRLALPTAAYDL
jgi:hypothetical protein